jgi:hypothetical protein
VRAVTADGVVRIAMMGAGVCLAGLAAYTLVRTSQTHDEASGCFGVLLALAAFALIVFAATAPPA